MRKSTRIHAAVIAAAILCATAVAQQAAPKPATRVIGTHQIDRYAALEHVRQALLKNPNNVTDWVLLGELSHEIAAEAGADVAPGYYRLSRESYDNALKLEPNNAHIKAAAEFARAQEGSADRVRQSRAAATTSYIEARRQELTQSGYTPTVRTYQTVPAQAAAAATYAPRYQTYVAAEGNPYTYQQHYDMFYGPIHQSPGQGITATESASLVKPAARFAPP